MIQDDPGAQFTVMGERVGVHAGVLDPILQQSAGNPLRNKSFFPTANPKIPVFVTPGHVWIVAPGQFPGLAAIKRAIIQLIIDTQLLEIEFRRLNDSFRRAEMGDVRVGNGDAGILFQQRHGLFQHGGRNFIVSVERQYVGPARGTDAGVAGVGQAAIFLFQQADAAA